MNPWLALALRISGGLAATWLFWWWGLNRLAVQYNPFTLAAWVAFTGLLWFPFIGLPAIRWLGDRAGSLFMPDERAIEVRPQYSIAEARVAQGRYAEAVAAFRADIEKFPVESYPHVRIAELLREKLNDPDAALAELHAALRKATGDDAFALVAGRLADWLVEINGDRAGAAEILREVETRLPGTKHARAAAEHRARLQ